MICFSFAFWWGEFGAFDSPPQIGRTRILHLIMEAHYPNCDKLFVLYEYLIVNRKFTTGTRSTTLIFSLIKNYGKKSGHKGFNSSRYNILIQFSTIKVLLIFSCFPYRVRAQFAWRATGKPNGPMAVACYAGHKFWVQQKILKITGPIEFKSSEQFSGEFWRKLYWVPKLVLILTSTNSYELLTQIFLRENKYIK